MKRHKLFEFFKEDNGQLSSMRLIMIFTCCGTVPAFLLACFLKPSMMEIAGTVFLFAGSVTAVKAAQKKLEEKTDETNTDASPPTIPDEPPAG